jgi:hypothetical protein
VIADDLFRLAHSDTTGRPRLHPRAAGVGLAAALLAELMLASRITVQHGSLAVLDRRPPEDALAHTVLEQLVAEPAHRAVRTWLDFFGQTAVDAVGERLYRAGHVTRVVSRWRRAVSYPPTDMSEAAWPEARLRMQLTRRDRWTWPDIVLAGLVGATGLARQVLWDAEPAVRQYHAEVVGWLPPRLAELVAQTEAAVGDAVLSHRT